MSELSLDKLDQLYARMKNRNGESHFPFTDFFRAIHEHYPQLSAQFRELEAENERYRRRVGDLMQPMPGDGEPEMQHKLMQHWAEDRRKEKEELRQCRAELEAVKRERDKLCKRLPEHRLMTRMKQWESKCDICSGALVEKARGVGTVCSQCGAENGGKKA